MAFQHNNMKALFIIVTAGYADDVIAIARETGVRGATILNTRGEGMRHESFMGITMDSEQEMIFCIVDETTAIDTMDAIKEKAGEETPFNSVCFTMPVEKMVGVSMSAPKTEKADE